MEAPIGEAHVKTIEYFCPETNFSTKRTGKPALPGIGDHYSSVIAVVAAAEVQINLWWRRPGGSGEWSDNDIDLGISDESLGGARGRNLSIRGEIAHVVEKLVEPRSYLGSEPVGRS